MKIPEIYEVRFDTEIRGGKEVEDLNVYQTRAENLCCQHSTLIHTHSFIHSFIHSFSHPESSVIITHFLACE